MPSFRGTGSAASRFVRVFCALVLVEGALATQYKVGDASGWTAGTTDFNEWASKNAFKVGDSLLFTYHPNTHSVHQVNKEDYEAHSIDKPIKTYNDGESLVDLRDETTYYFVGEVEGRPAAGMKLEVAVRATASPSGSPSPAPVATAPVPSPSVPAPTPNKAAPAPSPVATPPTSPPPTPTAAPPTPAPARSPSPSPSPPPPSPSPPPPSPSPSAPSAPPSSPPSVPPPSSPPSVPPTVPSPSSSPPSAPSPSAPSGPPSPPPTAPSPSTPPPPSSATVTQASVSLVLSALLIRAAAVLL